MKSKINSIVATLLTFAFFLIVGWYWIQITQPDFTLCPLCNQSVPK